MTRRFSSGINIRKNQRGDTIMEVLICISILGLLMAAAFSLVGRNQTTGRQAQERSEAQQAADSQLELLKTYADINKLPPDQYFCVYLDPITSVLKIKTMPAIPASPDTAYAYPPECVQNRYNVAVWSGKGSPAPSAAVGAQPGVYAVTVRWQSAGKSVSVEESKIFYTIYDVVNPLFATPPPPPGPTADIFPLAPVILAGSGTIMTWTAGPGATSCTITSTPPDPNPGTVNPVPIGSGTFPTGPLAAGSHVYTNTCRNVLGIAGITKATTVTVNAPVPSPVAISPGSAGYPAWHLFNTAGVKQTQVFTVRNPSTSPSPITITTVTSSNTSSFQIISNGCSGVTLVPNAACTVTVQFFPPSGEGNNFLGNAGLKTGILTVNNSSGAAASSASLAGWAVSDRMAPNDRMYITGDDNDNASRGLRAYNPACYNNAFACGNLLVMWSNGNLVEYTDAPSGAVAFASGATAATQMYMQGDGNLVAYDSAFNPIFYTGAYGGGVWLMLFSDSQLWLMNPSYNAGNYSALTRIWP